ncbi:hypothetical protein RHMOL_Rhmol01G0274500 [Rhododendron molle]|uniref:Uncharacterized protein n=1 Tax=Rhododendron molle TaxID=49168 RepID=A0ACC0Q6D2_RHOML|nr:hypothetical protein RHMOL_Rhmol01G0274500 [Rhododendron molle]
MARYDGALGGVLRKGGCEGAVFDQFGGVLGGFEHQSFALFSCVTSKVRFAVVGEERCLPLVSDHELHLAVI